MKKLLLLAAAACVPAILSGCSMAMGPVMGGLYTSAKGPVSLGDTANVKPMKSGTAVASAIVGIATGDASLQKAMSTGGITKVHHADCETMSIMGFYATYKLTVWGE